MLQLLPPNPGPRCSHLELPSFNGQARKFHKYFQNHKSLIAKEIGIKRARIAGELRANDFLGGVCNARTTMDAAGRNSPGTFDSRSSFAGVRSGERARPTAGESLSLLTE